MNDQEVIEQMTKFIRLVEQNSTLARFNNWLIHNSDTFDPFYIDEDVQLTDEDIQELYQEFKKSTMN